MMNFLIGDKICNKYPSKYFNEFVDLSIQSICQNQFVDFENHTFRTSLKVFSHNLAFLCYYFICSYVFQNENSPYPTPIKIHHYCRECNNKNSTHRDFL